jgi:hypothetical protein
MFPRPVDRWHDPGRFEHESVLRCSRASVDRSRGIPAFITIMCAFGSAIFSSASACCASSTSRGASSFPAPSIQRLTKGGNGGNGGTGGNGGGATGGSTYALFKVNTTPSLLDAVTYSHGAPGNGGGSPTVTSKGAPGVAADSNQESVESIAAAIESRAQPSLRADLRSALQPKCHARLT